MNEADLNKAEKNNQKFTDKKRKNILYKIRDKIFLLIKNINIIRSLKKLNYKIIESYKIIQKTESSYKLNLLK